VNKECEKLNVKKKKNKSETKKEAVNNGDSLCFPFHVLHPLISFSNHVSHPFSRFTLL